jgi:hypothetical protein
MKSFIGAVLFFIAFSVNAAVIHTYEFGNTANGGPDSGTLTFTSEGTPVPNQPNFIESDYGDLKATINGTYYDFSNLMPPGGGWTQIVERYLYDFTSPNSRIQVVASFERGAEVFQYSLDFTWFDEPTGFGIGALWLRAGIVSFPKNEIENYSAEEGYLHTTSPIPIPPAAWLFGSGLIGLIGLARRKA